MPHPGAIVTGRADLLKEPSEKGKWWEAADPTYRTLVRQDRDMFMGADENGEPKVVGFLPQKEWTGSWREFMAEEARPKPNTMSSLHYTMVQTDEAYVFNVTTHWDVEKTRCDFDEVTIKHYRPVAYVYLTGPPPKASGNYPLDGPRGEKDMNRGRITLPRGADLARLREKGAMKQFMSTADGTVVLTIPKAPKDESKPTSEFVSMADRGFIKQKAELEAMHGPGVYGFEGSVF